MATGPVGGSTLDVRTLVSQLVAAEAAPQQRIIQARELKYNTTISALGALKGALSGFQNALEPLRAAGIYDARSATSANNDIFSATADAKAAAGAYEIEVLDLASSHQLRSGPFIGGTTDVVGTGTLTIGSSDGSSFSVDIDADNNTLAGVAAAINASEDNKGRVQATIIKGTDGARLVLSSTKTGADSAMTVSQSGGDGGLQSLVYDPNGTKNLTETQKASDARISLAGVEATSNTNAFADVIEGVTISVKSKPKTPGETTTLTVARNMSATTDAVKKFVSAYNAMQGEIAKQRAFDPATKAAGALFGDTMLRGIETQVRDALNNPIEGSGVFSTLASLGIKTNAAGKLELDEAKLKAATDLDPTVLNKAFGGDNGMAQRMYDLMKTKLANGAEIESRSTAMSDGLKQLDKQKEAIETRLTVLQSRLMKQYTALDSLLSSMQSQSAFLSQQLSNLPGAAK